MPARLDRAFCQFCPRRFASPSRSDGKHFRNKPLACIAGYTIIALVFVGTMGLAYLLARKEAPVLAGVPPARIQPMADVSPAESGCSGTRVACKSQPARLPLQFPVSFVAAGLCWLCREIGTAAGIAFMSTNLSAPHNGVCNGRNRRPIFAN